jgi:NAD(P)-dependent dehydrogenase (short-subunit alcohol dehydrogenase family)
MSALSGKVAFVTGGASGIGKALSEALARQGASVVVADRNGAGAEAVALTLDVTDADAMERAVADVWTRKGAIDLFFNNAGIGGPFGEMTDVKLSDWRKVLDVNLHGVIHGVAAVYPRMVKRRSGHIINTASAAGLVPSPWSGPYTAAKHAVMGLTNGLRTEAFGNGVRVSAVCPGFIDTNLFQQSTTYETVSYEKAIQLRPQMMDTAACARAILKGVAANRAIITVTLFARMAWWVWRLWPGLVFWFAQKAVQRLRALR